MRTLARRSRLVAGASAALLSVALLASCSSGSSSSTDALDSVDTFAFEDTPSTEGVDPALSTDTSVAPGVVAAVVASSSEAKIVAQRENAGSALKGGTLTFSAPQSGAVKLDSSSQCSGPGNIVEGEPFVVGYQKGDNAISAFSLKVLGSYESPGTYSADATWTDATGAHTGTGTMFVYDDEASGEFSVTEAAVTVAGTWECTFKK